MGQESPSDSAPGTQPGDRQVHIPSSISNNLDSQGNLKTQGYRQLYGAYSERLDSHSGESSLAPH
eukprot:gene25138-1652_t